MLMRILKFISMVSNTKMMVLISFIGMLFVVMFRNHLTSAFFLRSEENSGSVKGLAMDGTVDVADLHKQDARMLNDMSNYFSYNRKHFKSCTNNAVSMKSPLYKLNTQYINSHIHFSLPLGGLGIVSVPRKRATCLLMKLALTLPEGDVVETGSFIGTSAVLILNILKDFDHCRRKLWVFDSFEGLPIPSKEDKAQGYPGQFYVTLQNFTTNLISQNVFDTNTLVITKGWFKDTLPISKVQKIAFLRLDGDLFESTWDAITALYDRVIPGGIVYVDDFGSFIGCATAIEKFRTMHKIYEPLHYILEQQPNAGFSQIVFEAVWWVKRY